MDHLAVGIHRAGGNTCSTPFGINEWITASRPEESWRTECAQRLSASTNGSPRGHRIIDGTGKCSTPFGINEWITFACRQMKPQKPVLNAFRHQRMDHTYRTENSPELDCAQRLSASTNGSHGDAIVVPLAAMLCSTPFGINEWITDRERGGVDDCTVLNAFRHQRMDHKRFLAAGWPAEKCSTPFGINEWITTTTERRRAAGVWCSTPFGINEWITWVRWRVMC